VSLKFEDIWPQRIDGPGPVRPPEFVRIRVGTRDRPRRTAVLMLAWNAHELTNRCLERVVRHTDPSEARLVFMDNGSEPPPPGIPPFQDVFASWRGDGEFIRATKNVFSAQGYNRLFSSVQEEAEDVVLICGDCEPKSDRWLTYFRDALGRHGEAAGILEDEESTDWRRAVYQEDRVIYPDRDVQERMDALFGPGGGGKYVHLYQFCFMIKAASLLRLGLYLQDGRFYQHHHDWELSARMDACPIRKVFVTPDVHHHHQIAGMWAMERDKYDKYAGMLADPATEGLILEKGRLCLVDAGPGL